MALPRLAPSAEPQPLERMKYNHPGLEVDLGVGLWAWPLPMDYDADGDLDLLVSCSDVPYNGTYLFENPGNASGGGKGSKLPVFRPAVRIGEGIKNIAISHVDGEPRVLVPGAELTGIRRGDLAPRESIYQRSVLVDRDQRVRANQWSYADFDGDGLQDVIVGHGLWADYGWDDAFDDRGRWTRGPLHGPVYWLRNNGTKGRPKYGEPEPILAGGDPVDVYGMPSPNLADFDADGDLDLLCGDFLDGFTYFQNVGTRTEPRYAVGRELMRGGEPLNMPLCMIVVTSIDWDQDGDIDLVVGQEDGRVALVEHTGTVQDGMPVFAEPVFFRQQADEVKFGALVTPVSFDWDGDGDEDLVCGNTAGEIGWIENLDGGNPPKWAAPQLLKAGGDVIRIMAGESGSIQGPAEAKWGYTTIDVADWDHDGLPDLVANSIWGKVVWYRNVGTRTAPRLAVEQPVRVRWDGPAPKPAWNWWDPADDELATQWRTTPCVVDWDQDGLNDLVMLDHEGYLAWFPRQRDGGELVLRPGRRIFQGESFDHRQAKQQAGEKSLRLNVGTAGKSGRRKLCVVDWDGDGKRDLLVNSVNVNLLRQVAAEADSVAFVDEGPLSDRRLAGHTTSPTTVDWDGDGHRTLLVGAEDGYFYHPPIPPAACDDQASRQDRGYNVLFFAVDDMRAELGCYGSPVVQSPHLDRLASEGLLFERAYCQQALCNPSRASLMTGLRVGSLGITDLPTHFRERFPDVVTLPQCFREQGYHTRGIGKLFHNWRQDDWRGDAVSWSDPQWMHYATHGSDVAAVTGKLPPDADAIPRTESRDVPDQAYFDGRIADAAIESLRELADERFFLGVGFWKPHLPFNAPRKYWELYEPKQISLPEPSQPPSEVPSIALHDSRELLRSFPSGLTESDVLRLRHGYYAAISYVDAQIGRVLDELERLELRDRTIVVFWSDHGFHLGEHDLWCKTSNFELDARVPMILSVPGQRTLGQRTGALVELIDLYPTLVELCGLEPPGHLEGTSLTPLLADADTAVKPAALTRHPRPAYSPPRTPPEAMGVSVRSDRFRYTEWRRHDDQTLIARELYDHQTDPGESVNLASLRGYAAVIARHQRLLENLAGSATLGGARDD